MTTAGNHSERSHALLSASGAGRWLNCTPSARLEEEHGTRTTFAYTEEGTFAHELSELLLRQRLPDMTVMPLEEFEAFLKPLKSNKFYSNEMLSHVAVYVDYCADMYFEASAKSRFDAIIEVEQRLDLTEYVPESFGTADCIIINDGTLELIDLKYGKGVRVSAEWNKQLMLYGLGALMKYDTLYDIQNVKLTIVQPRLDSISSWGVSVDDLLEWAETELKPKAELAFKGEGELSPGDWCRFCSVKQRCRKLYEQQMELARHEFADKELLTDDEIVDIIKRAPAFQEWISSILKWAEDRAVKENKQWPGLKLVEGRAIRKWAKDEDTVSETILERFKELSADQLYDMELKSLTKIEQLVGKKRFADTLFDLVVKLQGSPKLVPESDPRPQIGVAQAREDFSKEIE